MDIGIFVRAPNLSEPKSLFILTNYWLFNHLVGVYKHPRNNRLTNASFPPQTTSEAILQNTPRHESHRTRDVGQVLPALLAQVHVDRTVDPANNLHTLGPHDRCVPLVRAPVHLTPSGCRAARTVVVSWGRARTHRACWAWHACKRWWTPSAAAIRARTERCAS